MTKITNSKHYVTVPRQLVWVIVISNFEFVCHLVLVIWYLPYATAYLISDKCTSTG